MLIIYPRLHTPYGNWWTGCSRGRYIVQTEDGGDGVDVRNTSMWAVVVGDKDGDRKTDRQTDRRVEAPCPHNDYVL